MPRQARLVIPHLAHHLIQRGNRRQDVFFDDEDYRTYLALLRDRLAESGTRLVAYCLMTNHVHLLVIPSHEAGLRPIGEAHRRYTRYMNMKKDWRGYLWQGRFGSYPMDERYAYEALRYVELNPVRAGMCAHPAEYRWSSARQRLFHGGHNKSIVSPSSHDLKVADWPYDMVDDWEAYWQEGLAKDAWREQFEENEQCCKPMGMIAAR